MFLQKLAPAFRLATSAWLLLSPTWALAGSNDRLDRLLADLDALRVKHDVPAFGLTLVDREEVIWSGARGIADRTSGRKANGATVFRIGSITKTFTSLACLIAEQDGLLSLDDPVHDYVAKTPFINPWASTHPVRLAHLLEHTAGLADLSWEEMNHSDPAPISLEDALSFRPENRVVLWRPGVHSSYSNAGAGIAAYVLEQRIDESFEDFVDARIFEPLGMSSATFFLDPETKAALATGYDSDGHSVIPYWHMLFRPFGAINVRPADMAPFLQLLINRGSYRGERLLPEASVSRLETPKTTLAARSGLRYGYGLGNYTWYSNGLLFHGHGGDGDGYLAHYGYNRDTGMGYFIVINRFSHRPLRAMRSRIEAYIADGRRPAKGARVRLLPEAMRALAGTYEPITVRFPERPGSEAPKPHPLRIIIQDGRLYTVTAAGSQRELVPVSDKHFRRAHEPEATIAMIEDEEGTLILQGDIGNYRKVDKAQ